MRVIIALVAGLLFGAGLALSGMTDQTKVVGFLDLFGNWKLELIFVMAGAVGVTMAANQWVLKQPKPFFESKFFTPTNTVIDKKLLIGSGLFGVGWGLLGYCPGPAIAAVAYSLDALASGGAVVYQPLLFIVAMVAGMFIADKVVKS